MGQTNPTNDTNNTSLINLGTPSIDHPIAVKGVYKDLEEGMTERKYMGVVRDTEYENIIQFQEMKQKINEIYPLRCDTPNGTRSIDQLVTKSYIEATNRAYDKGHSGILKAYAPKVGNPMDVQQTKYNLHIGKNHEYTPLDQFNIKNILGIDILGNINLSLTNMGLFVILSTILLIYLYAINNNYNKLVPNNMSASSESIYATVHGIVVGQINSKKGQEYFPLIFVIFIFILTNNLIGMIPYAFATTSHFILTFSLSFTIVLGATFLGLYLHQTKFFSLFVPSGCPLALLFLLVLIEFISYLSRPVSLGLRLAANVLSGHMLLNILGGFSFNIMKSGIIQFIVGLLPFAFVVAFSGLEVGVAFIQAQVFIVLSCSYIKDGLDLH